MKLKPFHYGAATLLVGTALAVILVFGGIAGAQPPDPPGPPEGLGVTLADVNQHVLETNTHVLENQTLLCAIAEEVGVAVPGLCGEPEGE